MKAFELKHIAMKATMKHIARMNAEAGVEGARAWCMSVFDTHELRALPESALWAEPDGTLWAADAAITAALDAGGQILTGSQRPLCLFCAAVRFNRRTMPAAFVVVTAMRDDPSTALVHCLCRQCRDDGSSRERLQQRLVAYFQANIDPSFHWIDVGHGHKGRV
jgi:hypothetical protein